MQPEGCEFDSHLLHQILYKRNGAWWTDRQHTNETKQKIGQANAISQKGVKNSQYGTCWIHNNKENKKIKKLDIKIWLDSGWVKGRSMTF